ncbi:Sec-C motif domain protein [Kriegella sp. EG-1]|nr:Sec-C motif domain protein [Flavobacteriaceae bacterium EG-1]
MNKCYCGLPDEYSKCCGKVHSNINNAKTAEQLMRSRYSAFVMADGDYLMRSHHSSTRPLKDKNAIANWAKSVTWVKLEVIGKFEGNEQDDEGTVTFDAYYYENGKLEVIHEKSAFKKESKCWTYLGLAT